VVENLIECNFIERSRLRRKRVFNISALYDNVFIHAGPSSTKWNEDDVWHYTHGSIVGVNSEKYENIRTGSVLGPHNLDVLAYSIARQLDGQMLVEWLTFLASNPGFLRQIWHSVDWFFWTKLPSIPKQLLKSMLRFEILRDDED
jgi:hypothetical protein